MSKRIGYFGLSSPVLYDYKHQAPRAQSDTHSSPNPILEGAFGAMLLYDELWFLCESLCPANLRGRPFVKFLDQSNVDLSLPATLPRAKDVFAPQALDAYNKASEDYVLVRNNMGITWQGLDNHTHGVKLKGVTVSGNSWSDSNVIIDLEVKKRLGPEVELVVNSFTSRLFEVEAEQAARLQLTELLVLDRIPNYLTPSGPYHECVEEVRNDTFLSDFRRWMAETHAPLDLRELRERKNEVERKLEEAQRDVFLTYLKPSTGYRTLGKTVLGMGMDALVPGLATARDLVDQWREERYKQQLRWQGFIVSARSKLGPTA